MPPLSGRRSTKISHEPHSALLQGGVTGVGHQRGGGAALAALERDHRAGLNLALERGFGARRGQLEAAAQIGPGDRFEALEHGQQGVIGGAFEQAPERVQG